MAAPSVVRIDRTSSIESEPRTLNLQQIQFAREAALYVVNTRSIEEAFQIFTQGMEPITRGSRRDEPSETRVEYLETDCSCCFYSFMETKQQLKDALSAPF